MSQTSVDRGFVRGDSWIGRRGLCLLLLLVTVPAGAAWRFAPLRLPAFAWKYGGSALWAMAVYWLLSALLVRWSSRALGVLAGVVAMAVECLKLVYWPPLDRFRETFAGKLLLGRYFTRGAIVAYLVAIAGVALVDGLLRAERPATAPPDDPAGCNQGHGS